MPTKQQYRDKINALKGKKYVPSADELKNFNEINSRIPNGTNVNQWLKEEKLAVDKKLKEIEPDYQKVFKEASDVCEKKKEGLLQTTQGKIQEIDKEIEEAKKGKVNADLLFDLRQKKEFYTRSLESLNHYQRGNVARFSFGEAEWDLDLSEYEPFAKKKEERDDLYRRKNNLEKFAETKKNLDESEKKFQAGVKQMKDELEEKKTAFNSLNGWQKFWARVLPASWYGKAQDYADIKDCESVMAETEISGEEVRVQTEQTRSNEGQPWSKEQLDNLKTAVSLDGPKPEKQNPVSFEDMQEELELDGEDGIACSEDSY